MTEGTACRLSLLPGFLELILLGEYRRYNTLKYSISSTEFPDLAWLVPDVLISPDDLPHTLIAVGTIAMAQNLVKWLNKQLERFGTPLKAYPFHSIIPQED